MTDMGQGAAIFGCAGLALTPDEAATYCGCSRRHFEQFVAPHLPYVDLRQPGTARAMPRYLLADVASWLLSRRQVPR